MATTTSSPLDTAEQLQAKVTELAPRRRPQVLRKGDTYGVGVLHELCTTEKQTKELHELLEQAKPSDRPDAQPFVLAHLDVKEKVYNVTQVEWLDDMDAAIHELARFVELQVENPNEASKVIAHFLETNGHAPDQVGLAEECFGAAFALQTMLRGFPRLPLAIQNRVVEVDATTDMSSLLGPLFPGQRKPTKAKKSKKTGKKRPHKST